MTLEVGAGGWLITIGLIVGLLVLDLGLAAARPHMPGFREATAWSLFYIGVAIAFGVVFGAMTGGDFGVQYFAGYLVEKSLSIDNLFVFVIIMTTFAVPGRYQHKALTFGIIFALVMRAIFIALGATLLRLFSFMFLVFGLLLVVTAVQLFRHRNEDPDIKENFLVRLTGRLLPVTDGYVSGRLVTRLDGRRVVTPLFIVLIAIGSTDLLFALDSIPAVFGVTEEPYIVFVANAFALLGLRALFFLVKGLLDRLVYLSTGLALVLAFIGVKLILHWVSCSWSSLRGWLCVRRAEDVGDRPAGSGRRWRARRGDAESEQHLWIVGPAHHRSEPGAKGEQVDGLAQRAGGQPEPFGLDHQAHHGLAALEVAARAELGGEHDREQWMLVDVKVDDLQPRRCQFKVAQGDVAAPGMRGADVWHGGDGNTVGRGGVQADPARELFGIVGLLPLDVIGVRDGDGELDVLVAVDGKVDVHPGLAGRGAQHVDHVVGNRIGAERAPVAVAAQGRSDPVVVQPGRLDPPGRPYARQEVGVTRVRQPGDVDGPAGRQQAVAGQHESGAAADQQRVPVRVDHGELAGTIGPQLEPVRPELPSPRLSVVDRRRPDRHGDSRFDGGDVELAGALLTGTVGRTTGDHIVLLIAQAPRRSWPAGLRRRPSGVHGGSAP
jgi:tellurite resistance protein TerC